MLTFFNKIIDWFRSLFWKEEMELTLVGLQNSGKTTFVNVIAVSVESGSESSEKKVGTSAWGGLALYP